MAAFLAAYLQIIDLMYFSVCLTLAMVFYVSNVTNIVALFFSEDLNNGDIKQV